MTIQQEGQEEVVTLSAKGLSIQSTSKEFFSQIEKKKNYSNHTEFYITPWNLTFVLRNSRNKQQVYVDLYLGEKELELDRTSLRG